MCAKTKPLKLSIVIVNWNAKEFLYQCLQSIEQSGLNGPLNIIIVDNCSTDNSVNFIRQQFPQITIIANKNNIGFARANNQGIKKTESEYILLLNPDTVIFQNSLSTMIALMDESPNVGVCGPRILDAHKNPAPVASSPKTLRMLIMDTFAAKLFPRVMSLDKVFPTRPTKVRNLSGCCLLLRRKALMEVGTLNEDLFLYYEEPELIERLLKKGWYAYYLPQSEIVHYGQKSTSQISKFDKLLIDKKSGFELWRTRHGRLITLGLKVIHFLLVLITFFWLIINRESRPDKIAFYKSLLGIILKDNQNR